MNFLLKALSLVFLLFVSTAANAEREQGVDQNKNIYANESMAFGIHTELANVNAHELVYFGTHKLSELIWDTKNVFMLSGDASITVIPPWGIKLNVSASTAMNNAKSTMDDFDWLLIGADWTHWSHHNNTKLKKGLTFDVGLSATLYTNKSKTVSLDFLSGYKRDQWKWGASGGTFVYSGLPGFRDITGTFANVPVISYEQTVSTPYIGMAMKWREDDLTLGIKMIGSIYAKAKAVDYHYLRSLVFTDSFKRGSMIGGDVDMTYHVNKNISFNISYSFQSYIKNRGDTVIFDQVTTASTFIPNDAGMSLNYRTYGIGASLTF